MMEGIRHPPVEVGGLSHYLQGFYTPGACLGFLPSTVALESSLSSLCTSSANRFYTHSKKNLTEKY